MTYNYLLPEVYLHWEATDPRWERYPVFPADTITAENAAGETIGKREAAAQEAITARRVSGNTTVAGRPRESIVEPLARSRMAL